MTAPRPYVVFRVGSTTYAVPVGEVREVVPARGFTRLPGANEAVAGLMNVRGRVVTVLDVRRRLGDGGGEGAHVLLLNRGEDAPVGVVVDGVDDVWRVSHDVVEAPRAGVADGATAVAGVLHRGDDLVILLDLDKLLTPASRARHG